MILIALYSLILSTLTYYIYKFAKNTWDMNKHLIPKRKQQKQKRYPEYYVNLQNVLKLKAIGNTEIHINTRNYYILVCLGLCSGVVGEDAEQICGMKIIRI